MENNTGNLCREYWNLKYVIVPEMEGELKKLKEEMDAKENLLASKFQEEGIQATSIEGLGTLRLNPELFFYAIKENESDKMAWFKAHNEYQHCIKEYIFPATFKKVMGEVFDKQGVVPSFVKMSSHMGIATRKIGSKE
jgi:hypothetical protein